MVATSGQIFLLKLSCRRNPAVVTSNQVFVPPKFLFFDLKNVVWLRRNALRGWGQG